MYSASQADSLSRIEDSPQETGSKQAADEGAFTLRQGRRQNRGLRGPRTTEEQVARLAAMVAECRQEAEHANGIMQDRLVHVRVISTSSTL